MKNELSEPYVRLKQIIEDSKASEIYKEFVLKKDALVMLSDDEAILVSEIKPYIQAKMLEAFSAGFVYGAESFIPLDGDPTYMLTKWDEFIKNDRS